MAVRAVDKSDQEFQEEAFTRTFVELKITDYGAMLKQFDDGAFNFPQSRRELERALNRWLDELCSLAEIRWRPSPEEELKMSKGWRN